MSELRRETLPSITAFIAPRVDAHEKQRRVSSVNAPVACSLLTARRNTYRSKREPREPISDDVEAIGEQPVSTKVGYNGTALGIAK